MTPLSMFVAGLGTGLVLRHAHDDVVSFR